MTAQTIYGTTEPFGRARAANDARAQLLSMMPVMKRRIELAGISTAVLEGGDGPPLVLLHGPSVYAAAIWFQIVPQLARSHRIVAPDLPGHGDSVVPGGAIEADRVLDWLGALIDRTCPSPPVLVGQILGGAIAARFASRNSDRLSRLVLDDTLGLAPFEPAPAFGRTPMEFTGSPGEETHDSLWRQCDTIEDCADDPPVEQPDAFLKAPDDHSGVVQRLRRTRTIRWGQWRSGERDHGNAPASAEQEGRHTMTAQKHTVEAPIEAARRLAPIVARRATEVESARRTPRDLLDDLAAAGCFRVLTPTSHGGLGADLPSGMRIFEILARADASVGWTVMIGGTSWIDLVGLPRATFDKLFTSGPSVVFAGVFSPSGSITAVEDGYRVTGRWSFASGCEHADWLFGNNVERTVDGVPRLRIAVFSPNQVCIEDTWNVAGLSGTGSHHFHVDDVLVSSDRTLVPLVDEPCIDAVIARIPPPALLSLSIASIAVGIGQGALDDIIELATKKTPLLAESILARNGHFQLELANADTALRAARALLYESAESMWATVAGGAPLSLEDRARTRAAAVWATNRAIEVVTSAYRAGGGSSVYASSPLQRRLRDVNALAQHFLVRNDTLTTAGAILAGQDISVTVF